MTPSEIMANLAEQLRLKDQIVVCLLESRWAKAKVLAEKCDRIRRRLEAHYADLAKYRPPE